MFHNELLKNYECEFYAEIYDRICSKLTYVDQRVMKALGDTFVEEVYLCPNGITHLALWFTIASTSTSPSYNKAAFGFSNREPDVYNKCKLTPLSCKKAKNQDDFLKNFISDNHDLLDKMDDVYSEERVEGKYVVI